MPDGGKLLLASNNSTLDENFVKSRVEIAAGDYVVLTVSDTGGGMSQEDLEHAFEPFFTTKEVGQGSGLGLAMVYGFAKQSGGDVTIDSKPGVGTTVSLYLPRMLEEPRKAGQPIAKVIPKGHGETVLVVEDDPDVRGLAQNLLQSLGYEVQQAADGPAAMIMLQEGPGPDLLLTDVVLPNNMSGVDLAAIVRKRFPAISILFMSGYAENTLRQTAGADMDIELLNKPFRRQDFAVKVRQALDS
jgi:CheY-like chemotaxis protein